jgi:glutaredoxin
VLIGKENCNRCDILKNLLDEKGMQYRYVDVNNIKKIYIKNLFDEKNNIKNLLDEKGMQYPYVDATH